jgi:adenylate cyclase
MNHSDNGLIERLDQLIAQHLKNAAFSPAVVCQELGISRSQLHRLITAHSQLSISLYIRKMRLRKAQDLLANTDLRISEITYEVGIDSPQNFSKYFIQAFDISPTEFRKKAQQQQPTLTVADNSALSIAVLPFVNMSSDLEQEYFSDGITEEIINRLAQVPGLKVAGRTSSFTFKGQNQDLRYIGQQLNVNFVLEGSIRKSNNKLRITAQLNKVSDGYYLWSERYDRALEDVFDIQDEISLAILNQIKIRLLGTDKEAVLKRYTNNAAAYQLYLYGRFYHNKFAGPDAFNKAISYYQAAIDLDPQYAIAYSGMASCYLNLWFYRHTPAQLCLPQMQEATQRSLAWDDQIAESHVADARLKMYYQWDLEGAAAAFRKAILLNPNMAEAYGQYALCLGIMGKTAQAREQAAIALRLEPLSLIHNFYTAYICWIDQDFEEAIAQGKRLLEIEPNFWGGNLILGFNLIQLKQPQQALAQLELALQQNYNGITLSGYGGLLAMMSREAEAQEILKKMELLAQTQPVSNYDMGIVYACLGHKNTAYAFFEKAIELHEPPMLFFKYIVRDWLAHFKNDPQCHALLQKIGIKGQ